MTSRERILRLSKSYALTNEELDVASKAVGNHYSDSKSPMRYRTVLGLLMLADELERIDERIHAAIGTTLKEIADASVEYSTLEGLVEILNEKSATHKAQAKKLAKERE